MNLLPQVSVVMSVYNGAEHLAETIDSVLNQQDCEFEFIVVNDGSTDATAKIIDDFAKSDQRLRVIHQENTGLTRALIRGCDEAHGEFIARQDLGDISLPGRLKMQMDALDGDIQLAFVSCSTRYITTGGAFLYRQSGSGLATTAIDIIDSDKQHGVIDGPSHHGSVMFRREAYIQAGGYRPQFYFGQDWDLWYRLGMVGKFQMLGHELYQASIGPADISSGNKHLQEQIAKLSLSSLKLKLSGESDEEVLSQAARIRPDGIKSSLRIRRSKGGYFLGECLRRNGEVDTARVYFRNSVRDNPLNIKSWCRLFQIALTNK